jgi:ATP-dependent RNA helicase SUPV3L1/SUV3
VRLLWDICTIPDFRKLMLEVHADFLESLFVELVDYGQLRDDWVERHVGELERRERAADVEELVARIASVRTWTYVANRASWLSGRLDWEARTRALEDRLSDALHERLVARFVDAKKKHSAPTRGRAVSRSSREVLDTSPADPSHPFAKLAALRSSVSLIADRPSVPGAPDWLEPVLDAAHDALTLREDGIIVHDARILGRIARGGSISLPAVNVMVDDLGAGAKSRLQRRLLAFARDVIGELTGSVGDLAMKSASAPLRGLVHRLEQGLGTALEVDLADVLAVLDAESREALSATVTFARGVVYVASGLAPNAVAARVALATTWYGAGKALRPPSGGAVSFAPSRGFDRAAYTAIGYPVIGPRAIRADVLARIFAAEAADEAETATWLGASRADARKVIAATSAGSVV